MTIVEDLTTTLVQKQLNLLSSTEYEIAAVKENGKNRFKGPKPKIFELIPHLKHLNAKGYNIYFRPYSKCLHPFILVDDLSSESALQILKDGFIVNAIIETSPNNFQVWIQTPEPLKPSTRHYQSERFAIRYHGDFGCVASSAFGRLAGFTNQKDIRIKENGGQAPFVNLYTAANFISNEVNS